MKRLVVLLLLFASTAYGEIYTWKDARGTVFYTNSLDEIPARYRARAKVLDVATGKKSRIATAQPGGQAAPSGTSGQQPSARPQAVFQAPPAPAAPAAPATPATPEMIAPAPPAPSASVSEGAQQQPTRARRGRLSRSSRRHTEEE